MIFEIYWSWYEEYTPYLFEGNHRSRRRWERDCKEAIRRCVKRYFREEKHNYMVPSWIKYACQELENMGYKPVKPISWGYFGGYILKENDRDSLGWKRIVGKSVFEVAVRKNKKIEERMLKRIKNRKFLKEIKNASGKEHS